MNAQKIKLSVQEKNSKELREQQKKVLRTVLKESYRKRIAMEELQREQYYRNKEKNIRERTSNLDKLIVSFREEESKKKGRRQKKEAFSDDEELKQNEN